MLLFDGGLGFVFALVWIFCVVDVIMTPERLCRNLPKLAWVLIVLLFLDIGALAWLIAGRPWAARTWGAGAPTLASRPPVPAATGPSRPTNPDDDEEFLASLRLRAEEQRRRAREATERERQEPDKDLGL